MWNRGTRARRRSMECTFPMATPGEAGMPMSLGKARKVYQFGAPGSEVGHAGLQTAQLLVYFEELNTALLRGELGRELLGGRLELRLRGRDRHQPLEGADGRHPREQVLVPGRLDQGGHRLGRAQPAQLVGRA